MTLLGATRAGSHLQGGRQRSARTGVMSRGLQGLAAVRRRRAQAPHHLCARQGESHPGCKHGCACRSLGPDETDHPIATHVQRVGRGVAATARPAGRAKGLVEPGRVVKSRFRIGGG